jgi:hypothetical protein
VFAPLEKPALADEHSFKKAIAVQQAAVKDRKSNFVDSKYPIAAL